MVISSSGLLALVLLHDPHRETPRNALGELSCQETSRTRSIERAYLQRLDEMQ